MNVVDEFSPSRADSLTAAAPSDAPMNAVMKQIWLVSLCSCVLLVACRSTGPTGASERKSVFRKKQTPVRQVVCLFDQRPWLNADAQGDRDPEGIHYRVFLDCGDGGKGVLRDGKFHVEMYMIKRSGGKDVERELVSDWHYPTTQFSTVSANILGKGYHIQLRWARKDIAGHEIELLTMYEDPDGNAVRAATTRKRVPKYAS